MVRFSPSRLIPNLPAIGGGAAAALVALFFLILPDWRLEAAVSASGVPAILPLAEPPLGVTARALLMLAGAAVAGAVGWAALFLIWGPGGVLYRAPTGEGPSVRRADAHPDAPPRRPMTAADLGVPPPPAERPIPADLDQPLAAFHPAAIPDVPRAPVRPVPALAVVAAAAEEDATPAEAVDAPEVDAPEDAMDEPELRRIETFEMTPMVRVPPRAPAPVETPTVEALLQRLERGARRRHGAG